MPQIDPLTPFSQVFHQALVLPVVEFGDLFTLAKANSPYRRYLGGVYSDGAAVASALLVRPAVAESMPLNGELQGPEMAPVKDCWGQHMLCGRLFRHFAHFIGESLARVWYAKQHPELTLVWTGAEDYLPYQREILDLLGIENPAVFVQRPTRFESLAVPSQGHCMPTFFAPYFLDALGVVEPAPMVPGRKTYISRAGDHGGGYTNELALQRLLEQAGWSILYPERMAIAERFDALSSSEVILMVEGSAMSSFLFFRTLRSRVVTLSRGHGHSDTGHPSVRDYFGGIARDKAFDYWRLNLPKQWLGGQLTGARYELDLDAFERLMQETDFLSTNLEAMEPLNDICPHGLETDARVAATALNAVTTECAEVTAHIYRSWLHASAGTLELAREEIDNALACVPGSAYLHWRSAQLHQQMHDLAKARDDLIRALDLSDEEPYAVRMQLARLHRDLDDLPKAVEEARAAIALNPVVPAPRMLLADLLLRFGDGNGALAASRKAVELSPMSAQAHLQCSNILAHNRDFDEAVAEARAAIRYDGTRTGQHAHLSRLLRITGRFAEAQTAARAALAIDPAFAPATAELKASRNPLRRLVCRMRQQLSERGRRA